MSIITKLVATVAHGVQGFADEVKKDMEAIDRDRAARRAADTDDLTDEEREMIAARRAKRSQAGNQR